MSMKNSKISYSLGFIYLLFNAYTDKAQAISLHSISENQSVVYGQ